MQRRRRRRRHPGIRDVQPAAALFDSNDGCGGRLGCRVAEGRDGRMPGEDEDRGSAVSGDDGRRAAPAADAERKDRPLVFRLLALRNPHRDQAFQIWGQTRQRAPPAATRGDEDWRV